MAWILGTENNFGSAYGNAAPPPSRQKRNLLCSFGIENHLQRECDCKDQVSVASRFQCESIEGDLNASSEGHH